VIDSNKNTAKISLFIHLYMYYLFYHPTNFLPFFQKWSPCLRCFCLQNSLFKTCTAPMFVTMQFDSKSVNGESNRQKSHQILILIGPNRIFNGQIKFLKVLSQDLNQIVIWICLSLVFGAAAYFSTIISLMHSVSYCIHLGSVGTCMHRPGVVAWSGEQMKQTTGIKTPPICLICVSPCVFLAFLNQLQPYLVKQNNPHWKLTHSFWKFFLLSGDTMWYSCDYLFFMCWRL